MSDILASPRRLPAAVWLGGGAVVALFLSQTVAGGGVKSLPPVLAAVVAFATWHHVLLRWHVLLGLIVAVIFLIPIKRYELPGSLPVSLEPYRIVVGCVIAIWLVALVIDPRVRLRRSPLDLPVLLLGLAILASVAVNARFITNLGVGAEVVKTLTFFASFFVLYVFCTSVLTTRAVIDSVVRMLVAGGAVVGLATMYEYWTGHNVFNDLHTVLPVLKPVPLESLGLDSDTLSRSGRLRVYASAQHPIALAAVLVMIVPLAFYLWKSEGRRLWLFLGGCVSLGALGTISRTSVVMAVVVVAVFLVFRFDETRRLLPWALPALVVVYVALPNSLGSFYSAFFPKGGIIAEQSTVIGDNDLGATGRLADLGPWYREFRVRPIIGQGFGSRVTFRTEDPTFAGSARNARLLDNQWLGTMLELGLVGTVALAWLFVRSMRRLRRAAALDPTPSGWLPVALAASLAAFALGMLTYDAFGFVQVTIVAFLLLGIAGAVLNLQEAGAPDLGDVGAKTSS